MSVLGFKGAFGLQKELTFAGTVTGSIIYDSIISHNPAGANNYYRPDYIDNSFNQSDGVYGAYTFSGDLGGDCKASEFFGMVLQGVMGTSTFTATVVAVSGTITEISHSVFTEAQTLDSYMGVYKIGDSDDAQNIKGITFNTFNVTASKDSAMTWTANYIAAYDELRTATATVSLPAQDPFMFYQLTVTIDGATDLNIEGINFTINNNLEGLNYLEIDRKRAINAAERNGKVNLSLSIDTNYDTITTYREFWGSTTSSYAAEEGHRYSITIFASGFKYQASPELRYRYKIILPSCEINSAPIPQSVGRVMQTLDLTPVKSVGKDYAVQMELWNLRTVTY